MIQNDSQDEILLLSWLQCQELYLADILRPVWQRFKGQNGEILQMNFDWVNKKLAKRNLKDRRTLYPIEVKFNDMPITRYMTKREATFFLEQIHWFKKDGTARIDPKDTIPQYGILVVE